MTLIVNICCSLAILIGLFTLKKTYRLWPMHLFLIASETTNIFFLLSHSDVIRGTIYNVFLIVEAGAFIFIFKDILNLKQYIFIVLCMYILFFILMATQTANQYLFTVLRIAPSVIIVLGCFFYFYNLLRDPYSDRVSKSPFFWIVTGSLLHFLTNIPTSFLTYNIGELFPRLFFISLTIVRFFYVILYLCIIKAFLCRNRN